MTPAEKSAERQHINQIAQSWQISAGTKELVSSFTALFDSRVRHVPTRNDAPSLRKVASTDSATMRPVLGFSEGTFSIESVKDAESASTSITWQFRVLVGSA